jgi:hypothetical protein
MTAQQIFEIASAFQYEGATDDADNKKFTPNFLNVILQECFDTENSVRAFNGLTELAAAPYITDLATEIPYADAITRTAIPYALASIFAKEARDFSAAADYLAKYVVALNDARKYRTGTITDVYSGESEE